MKLAEALEDLATAWVAGYVGTEAMEPVSMKLYELESAQDRAREDAARPGPPYELAAKKIFGAAGIRLEGKALERASLFMHYGLALSLVTPVCAAAPQDRHGSGRRRPGHGDGHVIDRR